MDHVAVMILRVAVVERVANLFLAGVPKLFVAKQPSIGDERKSLVITSAWRDGRGVVGHNRRDGRTTRNRPRSASPVTATQAARYRRRRTFIEHMRGLHLEPIVRDQ